MLGFDCTDAAVCPGQCRDNLPSAFGSVPAGPAKIVIAGECPTEVEQPRRRINCLRQAEAEGQGCRAT